MTYHVPHGRDILQLRRLLFPVFHSALAEVTHAGLESLANSLRRYRLRNTNQSNFLWPPARALGCLDDPFLDRRQILRNRIGALFPLRSLIHLGDSSRIAR